MGPTPRNRWYYRSPLRDEAGQKHLRFCAVFTRTLDLLPNFRTRYLYRCLARRPVVKAYETDNAKIFNALK